MSSRSSAFAWLGFGAAVLLLVSPLKLWWARPALGWIAPFAIWLLLILLGGWLSRARGRDDL
jgi:hypothetical protein